MNREQLVSLLNKYLSGTASPKETEMMMAAIADHRNKELVNDWLGEHWDNWNVQKLLTSDQSTKMYESIIESVQPLQPSNKRSVVRMWKWAAAAAIVLLVGGMYYYILPERKNPVAQKTEIPQYDVAAPVSTHAVITLSDGRKILLDSARVGNLAVQENIVIQKLADGEIVYSGKAEQASTNTLYNPRGSKVVSVMLADGSRVWLNSESSLTYPTAFTGNHRRVQMSGEVYFEIAKDKTKPFIIGYQNAIVEVLGTHFNINAYSDESDTRTTLLEGSIRISRKGQTRIISPGQQAVFKSKSADLLIETADVNQVMAWRNGFFEFDNADLQTVMRQISRWYDVQIVYGKIDPEIRLGGGISRNLNLQYLLRLLKMNGVNTRLEGRKLFVTT